MNRSVSLLTEIPEILHRSLQSYLDSHPNWDQDRVFTAALSFFLLNSDRPVAEDERSDCARVYLESVFNLKQ